MKGFFWGYSNSSNGRVIVLLLHIDYNKHNTMSIVLKRFGDKNAENS